MFSQAEACESSDQTFCKDSEMLTRMLSEYRVYLCSPVSCSCFIVICLLLSVIMYWVIPPLDFLFVFNLLTKIALYSRYPEISLNFHNFSITLWGKWHPAMISDLYYLNLQREPWLTSPSDAVNVSKFIQSLRPFMGCWTSVSDCVKVGIFDSEDSTALASQ